MRYYRDTLDFRVEEETVLTLGKFDGLHRGHELLMGELLRKKKEGLTAVVFTFDIPPRAEIEGSPPSVLTTNEEKRLLFDREGVDVLIECPFTEQIRNMEPEDFIRWICCVLHVRCIVAGRDFCFGHRRAGNFETLESMAGELGYEAVILEKVQQEHRDISSSYIRQEIREGNIRHANELLGYSYYTEGEIIHGNAIGRTIGIPTINIRPAAEKLLPPNGVYASRVIIDGHAYKGVTNVGNKPTIPGRNPLGVETYLIDFSGDLYGKKARVEFLDYLRPERKFSGLEALKKQMEQDIRKVSCAIGSFAR